MIPFLLQNEASSSIVIFSVMVSLRFAVFKSFRLKWDKVNYLK